MKSPFPGVVLLSLVVILGMGIWGIPHSAKAETAPIMPDAKVIVAFVNDARKGAGLPVFNVNPALMQAALLKAQSLAPTGTLTHTTAAPGVMWWPLAQAKYNYQAAGENLAVDILDPQTLVNDWMNSPAHKANILNPLYTDIGIGVAEGMYEGEKTDFVVEYTAEPKQPAPAPIVVHTYTIGGIAAFSQLQSYANIIAEYLLDLSAKKAQASTHL